MTNPRDPASRPSAPSSSRGVTTTYEDVEAKATYNRKNGNDQKEVSMIRMFVRHTVNDYNAWRKVYDDFADEQENAGVRSEAVYQSVDNPNDVTVWHDFADINAARAFVDSAMLREAMKSAGVQGQPQVWFTNES
jgi:quinol monooxygenase YgiN